MVHIYRLIYMCIELLSIATRSAFVSPKYLSNAILQFSIEFVKVFHNLYICSRPIYSKHLEVYEKIKLFVHIKANPPPPPFLHPQLRRKHI